MTTVESQLKAITTLPGPSMAIFDGQIVVMMSLRGPSMLSMRTNSGSLSHRSRPGMAFLDGQVEVATILAGTKYGYR